MKTIGLLGGLTWHATKTYYERINEGVAAQLGPYRSAKIVMNSLDYGEVRRSRDDGNWRRLGRRVVSGCKGLQRAGADGVFICSNTIHRYTDLVQSQVSIPVLHIADALADRAIADGITQVALFGTAFTMTQPFYRERLEARGLTVLVPPPAAIVELDRIILEELAAGRILDASRDYFTAQMAVLSAQGAQAMVLGCTEIGMLVNANDVDLPVLDTTHIHADFAVNWAID